MDQPDLFLLLEPCGCILDTTTGAYRHICDACHMETSLEAEIDADAVLLRPWRRVERVVLGEKGKKALGYRGRS